MPKKQKKKQEDKQAHAEGALDKQEFNEEPLAGVSGGNFVDLSHYEINPQDMRY